MARPLRIEFAGAIYYVTTRGNAQEDIYRNDKDRKEFLSRLKTACNRYNWYCHAYCLMDNHYHLLIETTKPTLSKGMKYLNGTYTQYFNRRHHRVGHVFQGRFKGILIERDRYLLELSRYIVLNPLRAKMVRAAKDWPWSSYRATAGISEPASWLTTDWILSAFGEQPRRAQLHYRDFVKKGKKQPSPLGNVKHQIYLGSPEFVDEMQGKLNPKQQKQSAIKSLDYYKQRYPERNDAMAKAYLSGHYTLERIGVFFGVSYATVSRAVKAQEM